VEENISKVSRFSIEKLEECQFYKDILEAFRNELSKDEKKSQAKYQ
jgi:hypothetical protein